ncbi:MAG TPA: hypothetical protein VJN29_01870 [Intrasporangium sp.]|nr:hypothetical protein [Intrasporangium sp.]HKX65944.1 hypothetical protein [Intrasporangium sp.]
MMPPDRPSVRRSGVVASTRPVDRNLERVRYEAAGFPVTVRPSRLLA